MGVKSKSAAALPDLRDSQDFKAKPPPIAPKPKVAQKPVKEITLNRSPNEGFGFVIISSQNSKGSVIGMSHFVLDLFVLRYIASKVVFRNTKQPR